MKTCSLLLLTFSILFYSCQKELHFKSPNTGPASTGIKYLTLGTWDEWGKPNYLLSKDTLSLSITTFIKNNLPERSDLISSHPELFTNSTNSDISLTRQSDVYITYVLQGAGVTNTLAFYTYPTNKPPLKIADIESITYIFPSAGQGSPLEPGDKVKIGKFSAGTSIGFALLQAGWNATTKAPDNKTVHFFSTDILNPESETNLKKHVVSIDFPNDKKILFGFEDLERTRGDCDHDFNDVMFYATILPN